MAATGRGEKGFSSRRKNTSSQGEARKKGWRAKKGGGSRTPFQHIVELVKWVDLIIEVLDA
ncbi:MAG: hypothetical protein K8F91_00985, partial [Candidatus Obscuribacterales bacterium]|nr:hypothetical protein [Candidatus Obscuribacterales bacterium]